MPEESKPAWPKTEFGTTDWEAVFEDPGTGLIASIRKSQSPAVLRKNTILIMEKLHTRRNDPAEVERFTAELTQLIPDDTKQEDLEPIIEAVAGIIRGIKQERIQKSLEYLRQQRVKRRQGQDANGKNRRGKKKSGRRALLVWLGLGAISAAIIASVVVASLKEKETEPYMVLIEQMKSLARGEEIETHILGGKLRLGKRLGKPVVIAEAVPNHECLNIAWVLINHGSIAINGVMSRRMSPTIIEGLCTKKGKKATVTWYPKKGLTGK